MVSTNDMRPGQAILVDEDIMLIVEYQHIKPGKGKAFVKTKLRNLVTGALVDKTFRADEDLASAFIDKEQCQFLYKNDDQFIFMNNTNFDQIQIDQEVIGDASDLLSENVEVVIKSYKGTPIEVELPDVVELKVTEGEPGIKGDTATKATKIVKCETGLEVNVPLFIDVGEIIKVDTKSKSYVTRQ